MVCVAGIAAKSSAGVDFDQDLILQGKLIGNIDRKELAGQKWTEQSAIEPHLAGADRAIDFERHPFPGVQIRRPLESSPIGNLSGRAPRQFIPGMAKADEMGNHRKAEGRRQKAELLSFSLLPSTFCLVFHSGTNEWMIEISCTCRLSGS